MVSASVFFTIAIAAATDGSLTSSRGAIDWADTAAGPAMSMKPNTKASGECVTLRLRRSLNDLSGSVRLEKRTNLTNGERNPLLRLLPREHAHFGFRRQH